MSTDCNILYVNTNAPAYVNMFDMGTGQALPTFVDAVQLNTDNGLAGVAE